MIGAVQFVATYDGLVPCGKCLDIGVAIPADKTTARHCNVTEGVPTNIKYIPCQFCHFFVVLQGIIDFILKYIVFPLAILLIVVSGIMFFLYAENPKRVDEAKSLLTTVVIGLILMFSAWLIVSLFFTAIGLSDFGLSLSAPDEWFMIRCEIAL